MLALKAKRSNKTLYLFAAIIVTAIAAASPIANAFFIFLSSISPLTPVTEQKRHNNFCYASLQVLLLYIPFCELSINSSKNALFI